MAASTNFKVVQEGEQKLSFLAGARAAEVDGDMQKSEACNTSI
jgi:dsDNA-binding SOS-regulon protein